MIEIKQLYKKYGTKIILNNINLTFKAGQVYGIVGENGAGKTTLFRCISGLENYDGNIDSLYQPIKNHLGYLETNPIFMSYITGWEYLKLLCTSKKIDTENFEEQNIFNLPLDQYADTYSTGMQKKLALMGLLLRKNDIIILDEPFNGVDLQSNMIIFDIIEKLKKLNKTILISSHIFSTLSNVCDEIILLANGQIEKTVTKKDYESLEIEMKQKLTGNQLNKLILE